jgi:hypothetical protein
MFIVSSNGHDGFVVKVEEDDINIFGVRASIEKNCVYLLLENYLYFEGYLSLYLST